MVLLEEKNLNLVVAKVAIDSAVISFNNNF